VELMREGAVLVTPHLAVLGSRRFDPRGFDTCYTEVETEDAQRFGNILFINLAIAAAMYFFVPIQIGIWEPKFYLAVGLFSLLALVVLDDVRRSNALRAHRLVLATGEKTEIGFVTTDAKLAARVEKAMSLAIAAHENPAQRRR
jgi:hypothetical protein